MLSLTAAELSQGACEAGLCLSLVITPHWSAAKRFGELVCHVHANACSVITMKMVCSAQVFSRLLLILAAHRACVL